MGQSETNRIPKWAFRQYGWVSRDTPQALQMQGNIFVEHGQSVGNTKAIINKNGQYGLLGEAPAQETLVWGGQ